MAEQNNFTLTGLQPLPFYEIPAQLVLQSISPTAANYSTRPYKNFQIGTFWLNTTDKSLWYLAKILTSPKHEGDWIEISGGLTNLETLTGTSGGAVGPDGANNINILSSITGLTVVGNPATNTLTLTASGGGSLLQSLTGNSGGAVFPTAGGTINVIGDGTGITIAGNPGTNTLTASLVGGGIAAQIFDTDIGGPVLPTALGVVNVFGDGHNVSTNGATAHTIKVGLTGITQHSLQVGGASNALTQLGVATNGQLPIGSTGADPVLATLTAGAGISITNGAGSITIAATDGGAAFTSIAIQKFTANGTYTPTANMKYCIVEMVGGGGGAGAANATNASPTVSGSGGGAAGSYSRGVFSAATIGASQAVTVGTAGAGGTVDNADGATGGTTSLGVLLTAPGGGGGLHSASDVASVGQGGASGAAGSGGQLNIPGSPGQSGFAFTTGSPATHSFAVSGTGGSSYFGAGGRSLVSVSGGTTNGINGSNYGSGGSGAVSVANAVTGQGGNGSDGVVIITEFI